MPSGDIIQVKTGDEIAINSIAFEVVDLDGSGNGSGIVKVPMFNNAKFGVEFKGIKVAKGGCVVAGEAVLSHVDLALLNEEQRKKLAEAHKTFNKVLAIADSLAPEIAETYNSVADFVQKFKQGISNYVGGAKDALVMKKQFKAAEKYAGLLLENKNLSDSTRKGLKAAYDEAIATKDFFCSGKDCQEGKVEPKKGGPFNEFDYVESLCEQNKAKVAKLQDYLLKGEKEAKTVVESVFTSCSNNRIAQIYYKKATTVVKNFPIYTINNKDYKCFWFNGGNLWRFIESKSAPTDSKQITYENLVKLPFLNIDNIFRIVYVAGTCENGESIVESKMPKGSTLDIPNNKGTITYKKNEKGEWEVKFKIRDGLAKSGKITQSAEEFEKQMEDVAKEQLILLERLGGTSKKVSELGFYVKDMNTKEWLETIGKLGTDIWENAALPKSYWNEDEGSKTSSVKMPALFTGVSDGVVSEVGDFPQLIKLGYDVTTKAEVRKSMWEGVKSISPTSIKEMAVGAAKDKWDKYNNSKQFVQAHEAGFDAVGVVGALVAGKLLETIVETGKKLGKKSILNAAELVADIVKKRGNIRNLLDTDFGKDYAKKYFAKTIKDGNFEDWWKEAKQWEKGGDLNFEVHHVIPISVLEKNLKLQELFLWAKKEGKVFDFNSIDNGIPLQKKKAKIDLNGHTSHPKYDDAIAEKILKITESKILDNSDKFESIQELINKARNTLENEVLLGSKDVNQIITF